MKHKRKGFTLIEIVLFLAITGLLFVGIIVGTNNSIGQQRFTDSVQNFAEFLRSIYSQVSNTQSVGDGKSDVAIYGKLIVFGQTVGLDGELFDDKREQRIYVYDVVGDVKGTSTGKVMELLSDLNANVAVLRDEETNKAYVPIDDVSFKANMKKIGNLTVQPAGIVQNYIPRWGASIEKSKKKDDGYKDEVSDNYDNLYKGAILVVRHPDSGTVNTLVLNKSGLSTNILKVNQTIHEAEKYGESSNVDAEINKLLELGLKNFKTNFVPEVVDFCINPSGVDKKSDWRRNIRIVKNSRNASGVEIIDMDSEDNVCRYEPEDV